MTRVTLLVALAFSLAAGPVPAEEAPVATRILLTISDQTEVGALTDLVSIDDVQDREVTAWATPDQLEHLADLGYSWEELPTAAPPRKGLNRDLKTGELLSYPTYTEYVAMMHVFAADHPDICHLHRIGWSQRGREVLVLQITDNPGVEEDEPETYYTSTMHGNEGTGVVLLLNLVDDLLTSYQAGPVGAHEEQVALLVDELEIWVNPLANPDGYVSDSRYYASGRDPNRDFPDPERGDTPDPELFDGDPETLDQMRFAEAHSIVLSANYHDGVEVVNYPWDTWPRLHTDDAWFRDLSHAYADSCRQDWSGSGAYMDGFADGVTNGWAWYEANGTRQDYMIYNRGGREVTVEVAQMQPAAEWELPAHWDAHHQAMLDYLEQALRGVRGVVTDRATGAPVAATVTVVDHDFDNSEIFTDPDVGDFHRLIEPGLFTLRFEAHSYDPVEVEGVATSGAVRLDVGMDLAQGAVPTVTGTVRQALAGAPLTGARVEILEIGLGHRTVTGADGTFTLGPTMPGEWTFRIIRPGFQTLEVRRSVDQGNNAFDFYLQRDPTRAAGGLTAEGLSVGAR